MEYYTIKTDINRYYFTKFHHWNKKTKWQKHL